MDHMTGFILGVLIIVAVTAIGRCVSLKNEVMLQNEQTEKALRECHKAMIRVGTVEDTLKDARRREAELRAALQRTRHVPGGGAMKHPVTETAQLKPPRPAIARLLDDDVWSS